MSQLLIQQYLNQLQDLRKVAGTRRESVVREAFKDLLKGWARAHDLIFVPEYEIATPTKERRYVDGALLHALRVPFGYWEAKDEKDDLDSEIAVKLRRGYPQDNIIFEDSTQAVLMQAKTEVMRCSVEDVEKLEKLLRLFFDYVPPAVVQFRKAVEQFKADLPAVLGALRDMIEEAHSTNEKFRRASQAFLEHAQETINPSLTAADVREMLIQHILTEEIFIAVFPGTPFHQDNNVARELYKLEASFFTGNTKFQTLKGLEPYYGAIRSAAAQIVTHHEKQSFLKVIYEGFYKVYNPKAADRLGVVYTPNEIVRFNDRECGLAVRAALWAQSDRQGRRDSGPGRRHRHVYLRASGALPRPAEKTKAQIPRGNSRQRGGDPAVLRGEPEHRSHLRSDLRRVRGIPKPLFRGYTRQRGPAHGNGRHAGIAIR